MAAEAQVAVPVREPGQHVHLADAIGINISITIIITIIINIIIVIVNTIIIIIIIIITICRYLSYYC